MVTSAGHPAPRSETGVRPPALRDRSLRSLCDAPQVADEQQVLEVRGDGGEVLERLDRLLAPVRVPRAQGRREDLLQQRRLALGRGLEHAQVAAGDAVAGELGHRAHDLALGLVVVAGAAADLPLDDPEVLELADEPGLGAGLLYDVVERVERAAVADRERQAAQRGRSEEHTSELQSRETISYAVFCL